MDLPSEICVLPRLTTPEMIGDPTVARQGLNSIAAAQQPVIRAPLDGTMTVPEPMPDSGVGVGVGVGRAYGKVILIGEHVVVYGLPAIAVPLPDLTIEVTVSFATSPAVSDDPFSLQTDAAEHRLVCGPHTAAEGSTSGLALAVEAAMRRWHIADEIVEVRIKSGVPPARGLGFSAACATAVVRALADLVGAPLDDRSLHELVQGSEQVSHGQASGVDAAAVAVAKPIRFEAGVVRPIVIDHDFALVVADTGSSGSTRQSVARVRYSLLHDPAWARQRLAQAALVIDSAETSLLNGRLAALGRQLNEFQCLLDEFGVSSAQIERLVDTALAAGAYGAKLTGGGMGGCVLALTEPSYAPTVRAALTAAGATRTWTVSTGDWTR
jgi:mevalonate kinase